MDMILSSKFATSWWAAHKCQISENEIEDVDIPNLCDDVQKCLAGGAGRGGSSVLPLGCLTGADVGRGAFGVLTLGPAAALLHGAALLLLHKAKHTLQDTFELTQKIMLKNYQIDSDSEDSEEDEDSELERSSATSEMSKRVRTSEVSEGESDSNNDVSDVSFSEELGNDSDENEDIDSQSSSQDEDDVCIEVEDRAVQTCECVREEGAGGCGFDPSLKLGVMLLYDDHSQPIPSKIIISSINPRANI
ncbi:hypothetical protein RR48_05384 [Papilio machaon]|uniref:Uncharacterized protein n=1 Tax=Papilio machaon TaxID=76193 RepID=A0A0N1IFK8_PAPMA|nr:hypothetical protein RR48_05384 [Papilio machaon]